MGVLILKIKKIDRGLTREDRGWGDFCFWDAKALEVPCNFRNQRSDQRNGKGGGGEIILFT